MWLGFSGVPHRVSPRPPPARAKERSKLSSYFDEMARRASQGDPAKVAEEALERMRGYLAYIQKEALKGEVEIGAKEREVQTFIERLEKHAQRYAQQDKAGPGRNPVWLLEELHDLGHDIGRAAIRLRGGRQALDNPYYPGHWKV